MSIFAQGPGYTGIFTTLEKAKEAVMQSIIDHQGAENDPDPCKGWSWWKEDESWCFGIRVLKQASLHSQLKKS